MTAADGQPADPPTAPPDHLQDTPFARSVRQVVADLPAGTTATYGEVAVEAGRPGAARAVGGVLRRSEGLPWWRVVRADGSMPKGSDQARRLAAEGVAITAGRVRPGVRQEHA